MFGFFSSPNKTKVNEVSKDETLSRREVLKKIGSLAIAGVTIKTALDPVSTIIAPTLISRGIENKLDHSGYLDQVEKRFGVKIILPKKDIVIDSFLNASIEEELKDSDLKDLGDYFVDQLSKYPDGFLKKNGIKEIFVAKKMTRILGSANTNSGSIIITFPASEVKDDLRTQKPKPFKNNSMYANETRHTCEGVLTLHHELYHMIDDFENSSRADRWSNISDTKYVGHDKYQNESLKEDDSILDKYALAAPWEERAVLAERLFADDILLLAAKNMIRSEDKKERLTGEAFYKKIKDVIVQYEIATDGFMGEEYFSLPLEKRERYLYLRQKFEKKS